MLSEAAPRRAAALETKVGVWERLSGNDARLLQAEVAAPPPERVSR